MNDETWVKIHEDFGHKVADNAYKCETCGQSYEEYMDMTPMERTLWLLKYQDSYKYRIY